MEVIVNGELKQVNHQITIVQLLQFLDLEIRNGIAIAVNEQIVPKSNWSSQELSTQDQVIIIQATAGG
jgi:sulfur carrier protein